MKRFVVFLFFLGTVSVIYAQECSGPWCPRTCPEGEYNYAVGCGPLLREPTCANPNPSPPSNDGPIICDYTACYCKPPAVRDEETNKCVELTDCLGAPVKPA